MFLSKVLFLCCRKISANHRGADSKEEFFSAEDVGRCMRRVQCVKVNEVIDVDEDISIQVLLQLALATHPSTVCLLTIRVCAPQAFYAGHVLGAVMFHIRIGDESILYTGMLLLSGCPVLIVLYTIPCRVRNLPGDFNMTTDRHLGAARLVSGTGSGTNSLFGASIPRPDLLITESTYATLSRDGKRFR